MSPDLPPPANLPEIAIYEPRPLRALPVWKTAQWAIKPYEISYVPGDDGAPAISAQLWAKGRAEVVRSLQAATLTAPTYGAGFVVLHRSLSGTWLLTGWWAYDNILCTVLSNAAGDNAPFVEHKGTIRACVHELAVVEYERKAWIDTMMTDRPDFELWTTRRLNDKAC